MIEVTFSDFAKLAQRRALTAEFLAERFAGKIDRPSEFFHRVFQGQYAAVVIPYASVLGFYTAELHCHQDAIGRHNVCACGYGNPYSIGKNGRHPAVGKKPRARKSRTRKRGSAKLLIFLTLECDKNERWLFTP